VAVAAALVVLVHVGLLAGLTKHHDADLQNVEFLKKVWMTPPSS